MLRKAIETEYRNTLIQKLNKKIQEHKVEIEGTTIQIETMQKRIANKTTIQKDTVLQVVRQLGLLKDKVIFHKACVSVLEDFKNDL